MMISQMNDSHVHESLNGSSANDPLVNRVSRYLDEHPEVTREELLRDALERELEALESRKDVPTAPATAQEIQDHAWIEERLGKMRKRDRGFGGRLRGLFTGG